MKTAVIVQCRLSSTRLPSKAIFPLSGRPLLSWTLCAMKKVSADDYFVACDYDSENALAPICKENGFKIFAGSKDDVLDRFCKLIERENIDVVLRATADNPFLFFDAASELMELYKTDYYGKVDYITYTGLPHGSGIEIFSGSSLLKARSLTELSYDHEHVGPALYNHPDCFTSVFLPSPEKYNAPYLRTTIDTKADYLRALDVIQDLSEKGFKPPFCSKDVLESLKDTTISKKILFVPSIKKTQGTGHLRRCVKLALSVKGVVFIDETIKEKIDYSEFLTDFPKEKIITELPFKNEYDLIVCDMFKMSDEEIKKYSSLSKTVFIDEGSDCFDNPDYILDIIPSDNLSRDSNFINPYFIEGGEDIKPEFPKNGNIKKVLVTFGGEDPAGLTLPSALALLTIGYNVTVLIKNPSEFTEKVPSPLRSKLGVLSKIDDLKNHVCEYDLVVTHYGFTAYECHFANTPVLLVSTSKLHEKLSKKYGFEYIPQNAVDTKIFSKKLSDISKLTSKQFEKKSDSKKDLSDFILSLSQAKKYNCPVCQKESFDRVIARTEHHTFRKCSHCGMIYISFSDDSETVVYQKNYFADEYKKQYGKTYLDDFDSIKKSGYSRVKNILKTLGCQNGNGKSILDIGCAYGPFMKAASENGFNSCGTDIAEDGVKYINETLKLKAAISSFADVDSKKVFSVDSFDAVTMWYVIEHIKDLKTNLKKINGLLKNGGIFAFSTPSASGVSAKYNRKSFFIQSPKDHFTVWAPENTQNVLKPFGFKVEKIVSTGIHPERLPFIKKHNIKSKSLIFKLAALVMKLRKLGDTYEVYCKKVSGICDER